MELVYGIAGVLSLGFFAAVMGFDVRDIFRGSHGASWMEDDPNSTLGVMREVLGEKGEKFSLPQAQSN
ncbi:MAG: hypothetical protein AB7V46_11020 [Thermomicrobiales bacterium]